MKKPKGLGRGLDALIPPTDLQEDGTPFLCPIQDIDPHPDQPRKRFDPESLQEMVRTIQQRGVLSPVILRPMGRRFQLISGERRLRAAKLAGLERIPAIVRRLSDREAMEVALIENLQREDLTPLEEARAYHKLLSLHGLTQEALAQRLGKDRSTISNALRLLKLSPEAQTALEEGIISAGHARCLLSVPQEIHERIIEKIVSKQLSVRQTERLVQGLSSRASRRSSQPKVSPQMEEIRNKLRSALSTQVHILEGKRKGKIVIEYYGHEDLERILSRLLGSQDRFTHGQAHSPDGF